MSRKVLIIDVKGKDYSVDRLSCNIFLGLKLLDKKKKYDFIKSLTSLHMTLHALGVRLDLGYFQTFTIHSIAIICAKVSRFQSLI